MPHRISILVRADVGRDAIELFVTGCLTEQTRGPLASQITKARNLDPSAPILIDFTDAQHVEPSALERLRSVVDAQQEVDGHRPAALRFVLPKETPVCPREDTAELG